MRLALQRGDFGEQLCDGLFVRRPFFFDRLFFPLLIGLRVSRLAFFGGLATAFFAFLGFPLGGLCGAAFGLVFPTAHFDTETDLSELVPDQDMTSEVEALSDRDTPGDESHDSEDHDRTREREATTFWGACGAIRREVFLAAGGFNEKRYQLPSIEDVELGSRLVDRGVRIVLDPALQVKHLKRWTLVSLIVTDVMRRAIPWTLLWLERGRAQTDLNFSGAQRVAAMVSVAMVTAVMLALLHPALWLVVAALAAAALAINRRLFALLLNRGGIRLTLAGFFLQQLYYLYSLFGLAVGIAIFFLRPRSRHREQPAKQI